MKRLIYLLSIAAIFLCICGCQRNEVEYVTPVQLYYSTSSIDFHSEQAVIASETREYDGWETKPRDFLNQYLTGPLSPELSSPFPLGGWIVEFSQEEGTVNLLLNINFSRLSPNELTLACACLSMTLFELLDAETVHIQISSYESEDEVLTMTRDNLCLFDETQTE